MKPQTIGRTLGIGLRVAGRMAGQRLAAGGPGQAGQPVAGAGVAGQVDDRLAGRISGQVAGRVGEPIPGQAPAGAGEMKRALAAGVGGLLRPFRRVGGILWLEITGAFFLLPVLAFAPTVWRTRLSWMHGPDHRTFWAGVVVVTVFFYLGVSSFWRARRRSAQGPA
jgi:hypothetical protein